MLNILNKIAATTKRTEKESILSELDESQATLFKRVATATYSQSHDFWVKVYPRSETHSGEIELIYAINQCMFYLTDRNVSGNKALEFLTDLDSKLSEDDAEVLNRIILRDLKCGATESTFNKIWPDLVYVHPYMRCSAMSEKSLAKIKLPCYSQTKEDGQYVDIIVSGDKVVTYKSRSGKEFAFNSPTLDVIFTQNASMVFMGEALVKDAEGNILPRTEGNGYLNGDDIDPSRLHFVLWDYIPLAAFNAKRCTTEYKHRLLLLKSVAENATTGQIEVVHTRVCHSVNDIIAHMQYNVDLGLEGIVIKNHDNIWFDGTSQGQVKFKIIFDVELIVVGIEEGTNSNAGKLGALVCESSDGLIKVNVGIGFNAKQRKEFFSEDMIGKVITCRANDIVQNKSNVDVWSLFLPRFVEIRTDKKVADTYEQILEQKNAFMETLKVIK